MSTTHRMTYTPEYQCWQNMRNRCHLATSSSFRYYGARGIKVCNRWRYSFFRFHSDMGDRPGPGYSIERKDVNGDYEPSNCIWLHSSKQTANRRNTHYVTVDGVTASVSEWGRRTGIPMGTIWSRLKRGWTANKAVMVTKKGDA